MSAAEQVSAPNGSNTRSRAVTASTVETIDLGTVLGTVNTYNYRGYWTVICTSDFYVLCAGAGDLSSGDVVIDETNHDDDGDEPFLWPANTPMPMTITGPNERYLGIKPTSDGVVRVKRG